MVRESGISATKPIFPTYLLPTFRLPFTRRRSSASSHAASSPSSDSDDAAISSSPSTAFTTPSNSPPTHDKSIEPGSKHRNRLSRTQPDTLRCGNCSTDLAFASQIVSKGFTGRHGRAFLVAPPPPTTQGQKMSLLNLRVGRNESRQLSTGAHVVADISCGACSTKLGWKYVDAKEESQKYKIGKFILETERVVTYRSWGDGEGFCNMDDREEIKARRLGEGEAEEATDNGDEEIVFDSEDEDECEDVFAGTWDPETVAKRRRSTATRRKSTVG